MKKRLVNTFLVFCIIGVSIYYSNGKGVSVFNSVLEKKDSMPIHSVSTEEKVVSITINTGFGTQYTSEILDLLEDEGVKATFFVTGKWIDAYREDLLNIHNKKHEVGNSSLTYPHFTKISKEEIKSEIKSTDDKINEVISERTKLVRPPFGDYSASVIKTIQGEGYYPIIWDVDSLDNTNRDKKEIVDIVLKQVSNGSIILFNNTEKTKGALKEVIRELKLRGYKFKKVSDLIYKDGYYVDHTGRQKNMK